MGQWPHERFMGRRYVAPMSIRKRFFAATYDRQTAQIEKAWLGAMRERLLTDAAGEVLEIGAGTGANLRLYGPQVTSLTITEPEAPMLRRLVRHAREHAPQAMVLRAPAEDLPFDDVTFDVVVSTLVLCGVNDQPRALREIRRVLRPDGKFLFIEHVRSDDMKLARKQDRMNFVNRFVVGCDCNRPTLASIERAGFMLSKVERVSAMKVPSFVRPWVTGTATIAATMSSDVR
jgi:ubiquinone/menaquinone biosynthesis C-methylase UbiE